MSRKGLPYAAATFPLEETTGTRPVPTPDSGLATACTFARRLLDAGRASDAMQLLEAELEEGKASAEFQFLLGRASFRLGRHVEAHRAFSRAVSLSPQDAEVYRWLTRLLMRRDNALGAMRALEWTSRLTVPPSAETELLDDVLESPFDDEPDTLQDASEPATLQSDLAPSQKANPARKEG